MYQEYLNQLHVSIAPLPSDELKELLNDDEKLDIKVDEVLENLKTQKDTLLTENRSKAEGNIDKEPQIIELRGKVGELLERGKECSDAVQEKLGKIKEKSGDVSQETALALLQTAAVESEEASEALVQKLKDSDIAIETFLEEFLSARKTMHLRKAKADKLQELMRQQQAQAAGQRGPSAYGNFMPSSSGSGFYPSPTSQMPYPSAAGGVPYPHMGPMMPMPPPRPY